MRDKEMGEEREQTVYLLDLECAEALPVEWQDVTSSERTAGTVGDLLAVHARDKTEQTVYGHDFGSEIAEVLLSLQEDGINPVWCEWFEFDSHIAIEAARYSRHFFLVVGDDVGDRIVREHVCLHRSESSPSIFDDWTDGGHWGRAREILWYRRFYTETETGQLMVLRPDKPELLHFEREKDSDLRVILDAINGGPEK